MDDTPYSEASFFVQAMYDYNGAGTSSLSFEKGDIIEVLTQLGSGWWDGIIWRDRQRGWFPSNHTKRLTDAEAEWVRAQLEEAEAREQGDDNLNWPGSLHPSSTIGLNPGTSWDERSNSATSQFEGAGLSENPDASSDVSLLAYAGPHHGGWADWVPRASEDGRIFFVNTRTGAHATEMPSADEDVDPAGTVNGVGETQYQDQGHAFVNTDGGASVDDDDSFAFFDDHGFGRDNLMRVGILPWGDRRPSATTALESSQSASHDAAANPQVVAPAQTGHDRSLSGASTLHQSPGIQGPKTPIDGHRPASSDSDNDGRPHALDDVALPLGGKPSQLLPNPIHSSHGSDITITDEGTAAVHPPQGFHATMRQARRDLQHSLDAPMTRSLQDVEDRVYRALALLIKHAGPDALSSDHSQDEANRTTLAVAAKTLREELRDLLQVTGQLDSSVATHMDETLGFIGAAANQHVDVNLGAGPSSVLAELKPSTRRVTTEISKLLVAVRAIWALMGPAVDADPEVALNALSADDQVLIERRSVYAQERQDYELKLRRDSLTSAEELSARLGDFFGKYGSLVAALAGPIAKDALPMPRHLRANLGMRADAVILPGAGWGGNWRSNGFANLPELPRSPPSSTALAQVVPTRSNPSHNLTLESQDELQHTTTSIQHLCDELQPLLQSSQPEKYQHQHSLRWSNWVDIVDEIVVTLAILMNVLENINIAGCIDLDLDDADFGWHALALAGEVSAWSEDASFDKAESTSNTMQPEQYKSSMRSARQIISSFGTAKQTVYREVAGLVQWAQFSAATPSSDDDSGTELSDPCVLQATRTLVTLKAELLTITGALTELQSTSERQATAPLGMRRRSLAFRESLWGHRRSDCSHSSRTTSPMSSRLRLSRGIEEEGEDDQLSQGSQDDNFFDATPQAPAPPVANSSSPYDRRLSISGEMAWDSRRESLSTVPTNDSFSSPESLPMTPSISDEVERDSTSRSPVRSKKLAKFFGEDTAAAQRAKQSKPLFLEPDYTGDDISFNIDNQIRGGSLRGLVIKLTSHEGPDVAFLRVFLMTYRTFTTSHAFLDLLIDRYHMEPPTGLGPEELQIWADQKQKVVKVRVINVVRAWIESHLSDEEEENILQRVTQFAINDMADSPLARQIVLTCDRRRSSGPKKIVPMNPPGNPPPPIVPRNTRKLKFLDIDPLELARQLTIVDSELFTRIEVNECLGKAWPKEFAKDGTPYIKEMINMSNAITRWVAETILTQPDSKKRAGSIKHFINIADRCRMLNNFSTLMQIIAGLNSTPIHRLRRTWENVTQKYMLSFNQLNNIMSPTKNYAAYREMIRNMTPPCVPFLGVYLTDWTFIGDGNPDFLRERPHQINFNKRQKAAELIVQIQSYQSMPYQLTRVPTIHKFVTDHIESQREEQELFQMSLEIEPRERDDEKIARLLSESGFL